MKPIRFDLLRKLHAFILALPPESFHLGDVFGQNTDMPEPRAECGSVCCAMGWAPMVPEIRAEGLTYWDFNGEVQGLMFQGGLASWSGAAQIVFNLDHFPSLDLFSPYLSSDYDDYPDDWYVEGERVPDFEKRVFDQRIRTFFNEHKETL